jgi:HNH endonuclease/AP2 domain
MEAKTMAKRALITAERLREAMRYEPKTGVFTWLPRPIQLHAVRTDKVWNTKWAGGVAGYVNNQGYRAICVDWGLYKASRLAHLYMTGDWPLAEIDHANGDRADDRWRNLREATRSQNIRNSRSRKGTSSGLKGVTWDKSRQKWAAVIRINGHNRHLGYFITPERAWLAYAIAAKKHHGDFARIEAGGVTFFRNRVGDDGDRGEA